MVIIFLFTLVYGPKINHIRGFKLIFITPVSILIALLRGPTYPYADG